RGGARKASVGQGTTPSPPDPPIRKDGGPSMPAVAPGAAQGGAKKVITEPYVGLISVGPGEYKERLNKTKREIVASSGQESGKVDAGSSASADLLAFVLAGMFWGGISLVTPCVFPMIPITVSFFLKQAEKEHHRPVVMASVYSLTIVIVLTLAAAFLLSIFRLISVHPAMNYFLGALFIYFALSLFGMYEIELPSSLSRFTSARAGKADVR